MNASGKALLGISFLVALVVTLLLSIFAWPAAHTMPNRLPIGLVAGGPLGTRLPELLERSRPGAFAIKAYAGEAAARRAIREREVYGALLVDPRRAGEFKVLTASAGSPAVAQLLSTIGTQVGTLLSAAGFGAPTLEDVVLATAQDPRQATLLGSALPLVISGVLSGALLTRSVRRPGERLLGLLLVALLTGFAITAVMQLGFGTLVGPLWMNGLVSSLAVLAIASLVTGLGTALGTPGLGLASLTLMLVANPFSALGSAPEMLPGLWGSVGQLLPIGAFGSLMRSVAFFGGYGAAGPLWVLIGWAVFGLLLVLVGARQGRAVPAPQVAPI